MITIRPQDEKVVRNNFPFRIVRSSCVGRLEDADQGLSVFDAEKPIFKGLPSHTIKDNIHWSLSFSPLLQALCFVVPNLRRIQLSDKFLINFRAGLCNDL